jgi:hypothetical protein
VRELEAVLEEAMLLRGRGRIRPEDLALRDGGPPPGRPGGASPITAPDARQAVALELAARCGTSRYDDRAVIGPRFRALVRISDRSGIARRELWPTAAAPVSTTSAVFLEEVGALAPDVQTMLLHDS